MLPTTGFFKDIDCPYYDNSCDRPYCHFRHRKRNQERTGVLNAPPQLSEIPTYKPTPKSQLANTKSHIPISYVPDLVIRGDRNFRISSSFTYAERPTYKPTPLSELSKSNRTTNRIDEIKVSTNSKESCTKFEAAGNASETNTETPTSALEDAKVIDFEELSTEFDMIDEIINDHIVTENFNVADQTDVKSQPGKEHKPGTHSSPSTNHTTYTSKSVLSKRSSTKHKKESKTSRESGKRFNCQAKDSNKSLKPRGKYKHSRDGKSEENKKSADKDRHKSRNNSKHERRHSNKRKHRSKERCKYKDEYGNKTKEEKKVLELHKVDEVESEQCNRYEINRSSSDNELLYTALQSDQESDDLNDPSLEEECYRIFNEYKPEPVERLSEIGKPLEIVEEYIPTSKKRIAYNKTEQITCKNTFKQLKPAQNAALVMASRMKLARSAQTNNEQQSIRKDSITTGLEITSSSEDQAKLKKMNATLISYKMNNSRNMKNAARKTIAQDILEGETSGRTGIKSDKPKMSPSISVVDDIISGKTKPRRIAPAQNVNSIQKAKARIEEIARQKTVSVMNKTPTQTLSKGTKRKAHIPDLSLTDIPDVIQPENKKIPVNIRTRYLTMLADECIKLYLLKEDAFERALNEEYKVLERCAAIVTYRNSAMLAINRIRKELQDREQHGLGPLSTNENAVTNIDSQFKGHKLYRNIVGYVLTAEELEIHGYPREGPEPGKAVINCHMPVGKVSLDKMQRLCCRCSKIYLVDEFGIPLYEEECLYHPLKKRTLRGERIYLCCKSTEDTGCVTSHTHVSETELDLEGFQTTMDPESEGDPRSYGVYSLDCEMCYTTKGLELTRVTIIDADCKTVFETLVKPLNPIIDYNTRFSGITKEQMDRTSTSILQVQANILHLCNSKTILIGHSLESDMKALKIIHSCIIDTAVMFPHRLGLPHKRALRVLASEYLRKIIQSDVAGHDSAEDALTCMELVQWKVKEDLKVRGIK